MSSLKHRSWAGPCSERPNIQRTARRIRYFPDKIPGSLRFIPSVHITEPGHHSIESTDKLPSLYNPPTFTVKTSVVRASEMRGTGQELSESGAVNHPYIDSVCFLELSNTGCQPDFCIPVERDCSASNRPTSSTWSFLGVKVPTVFLFSSNVCSIRVCIPEKSKPILPSLASTRYENVPPDFPSLRALRQHHRSEAKFHRVMDSGVVHEFHTPYQDPCF